MLHIIFLILKILGIVLLVVAAAVIVLLAAVILLPVRYRAAVSCGGKVKSLKCRIRFHWLARLISGEAAYENETLVWKFRIAWKRFDNSEDEMESRVTEEKTEKREKKAEKEARKKKTDKIRPDEKPDPSGTKKKAGQKIPEDNSKSQKEKSEEKEKEEKAEEGIAEKAAAFCEKIKYTFHKIYVNIKSLAEKKENVQNFLTDEIHRNAFFTVLTEVKRLLRSLRPKKIEGSVEFGFDDPAHTGYVLAAVSMIYPLIGEYTDIRPDFEHKILKGRLLAEGKIRLLYFLVPAWNLYFNKDVKKTYEHIKSFKL